MKYYHHLKAAVTALAIVALSTPTIAAPQSGDGPYIVMVGTPAAGKSVNSELISKTYDIPWVNVRAVLLKEVEKDTKRGRNTAATQHKRGSASTKRKQSMKAAIAKLEAGELVSGDSLNALIASEVLSSEASGGFILDGYPMTTDQAEFLDSMMEIRGMAPLKVIYLNIPDEVALQRMKKRGRSDDKSGIRDERLRIFRTMIGPLLDYYGEEMVSEIDGTQSRSEIATEIAQLLGE
jgi:adenylate kinase